MQRSVQDLFDQYEHLTNAALQGNVDIAALSDLYDVAFIGSSPAGVIAGKKNDDFKNALVAGFERYREIGTKQMTIQNLKQEQLDAMHVLVRVAWQATYDVDGRRKHIDFTNVYLTRIMDGQARVFGWITGDENAELRKHGII